MIIKLWNLSKIIDKGGKISTVWKYCVVAINIFQS